MHVKVDAIILNPWGFRLKFYTYFHLPPTCFMSCPFNSACFDGSNTNYNPHTTFCQINTFSWGHLGYTYSLYSSRRVRPSFALVKTTGKVIILCNPVFKLRDRRLENQDKNQILSSILRSFHWFSLECNFDLLLTFPGGRDRDNSVGMATGYGLDVPGIESR
jgi:hypothetical protein